MNDNTERPWWRRWLLNRFVLVPGAIAVAIAVWNVHVSLNNDGIVSGTVVDRSGAPVAGATVQLWVLTFTTFTEVRRTQTGADGRFILTENPSHNIRIVAEKGGHRSQPRHVRLYFRSQNRELAAPLVLEGV